MVATSTLKQAYRLLERHELKRARLSRETQRRAERYVQQARVAGASWRTVGAALGITRQSAWERFRHLSTHQTPGAIPEEVLQARDMTPHAFARWVTEAAAKDPQIDQWLHTPDLELGLTTGHNGAMTPVELLRTEGVRTFLMTAEANRSGSK